MRYFILLSVCFIGATLSAQNYEEMMEDNSINFYDVCTAAEDYFKTIDREKKGSGYKGYQRWKANNEYKYYPSGNRSKIDPLYSKKSLEAYQKKYSQDYAKSKQQQNNGWRELGPNKVDIITGHYAAGIGRIEDVFVDPTDQNKMYLGSRSGGLWRSTNGGTTWQGGSTDFLPGSGVNTIAAKPTNSDQILINVQNSKNRYSYGIYRSTDGGATIAETDFNPTNLGLGGLGSNFRIYEIVYHPTIPNLVMVGTNKGVFKSTDDLTSWTKVIEQGFFITIEFHPTDPNIIYTIDHANGLEDYVYRSTDTGDTFVASNQITGNLNPNGGSYNGQLAVSAAAPDNVYFASRNGLWTSTDQGVNFIKTYDLSANPDATLFAFGINDTDPQNILYGGVDIFASTDAGTTFAQTSYWSLFNAAHGSGTFTEKFENSPVYVHADLRVAKSVNGIFYVGTDGTLEKSEDGGNTWTDLMKEGVGVRENYKLGVSQSDNSIVILGSQDNGTSISKGDSWIEFYGADGMEGIIHPLNSDWMISSFQFGGRRRTIDGGITNGGITVPNTANGDWQAPLLFDPNDHFTVYDFRSGVYKSTDFGSNYTLIGNAASFTSNIQQAEIAQNDSDIMIISSGSNIDKSIDGGTTFVSIKNNLPEHFIQDIAFDPKNDDRIIVVNASYEDNGEKVYITNDGGATWENISYNVGNIPVHTAVIDHTDQSNIYLGTEIGVFTKPMTGTIWTLYNTNLPNTTIEELEINYGANTLKAATWGRGLWEYDLIDRADFPSIVKTSITDMPTDSKPFTGTDQFITSEIMYDGNLTAVYAKWSVNNQNFDNTITMTNTSGNIWKSDAPLPDGTEGTKVYFKVFAEGSNADISETYKFMYTLQNPSYCGASGTAGTGGDYISKVAIQGILANESEKATYTVYDNLPVTQLIQGKSYTLEITLGAVFSLDKAGAWIDYNNNYEFEENEAIQMLAYDENNTSKGTFTIPEDVVVSETLRLRTRNSYSDSAAAPCGDVFGEVEDYLITIVPGTNGYCSASGSEETGEDYITGFILDSYENVSEKASYTFYDNFSIEIKKGNTYEVSITLATVLDTDAAGVWIDFNNDEVFQESEAIIMSAYNMDRQSIGLITIPEDAIENRPLRLRTRNSFGNEALSPCGDTIGEVEDYLVSILPPLTEYCSAEGSAGTGGDYISLVTVGDFENPSEKGTYTFYENIPPIELVKGENHSIGITMPSVFDLDKAGAWIDFNSNYVFEENEAVSMSPYDAGNQSTGTFVIPEEVSPEKLLRLRVRNVYSSGEISPCGSVFGEVEDYVIQVKPRVLSVDDHTTNQFEIIPIPMKTEITITSTSVYIDTIEIYDLSGRLVLSNEIHSKKTALDVSKLDSSIYLLHILHKGEVTIKKLIKE